MNRRARPVVLLAALLVSALGAPALQGGRAMSLDDLFRAVRVSDPQISPDGKWVAFVRTTTDFEAGTRNADVWIVPSDGSAPPRPLTTHAKADDTPRFSPDGKTLAFLSRRSGAPQVHLLDLSGGEARKLTDLANGAEAPLVWSPDGKSLAFASDVRPECADEACNEKKSEEAEKSAVKVHHLTRLLYRHWDEWRTDVRKHVLLADAATGATRDLTPGDFDAPTGQYEDGAIAFSPDGKELAFVSNREGRDREAWSTNMDVFVVSLEPGKEGAPERLTENPAADIQPIWLDAGRVAVRAQRRPGFEADRWWLDLYDRKSRTKKTAFESPERSVGDLVVSPDGKTVYFTSDEKGRQNVYAVDLETGGVKEVAYGGGIGTVRAGNGFLVLSKASLTAPAELFRLDLPVAPKKGAKAPASPPPALRALTNENAAFRKDVTFTPPESFYAKGAGGAEIHSWLVKPPFFDPAKKYPVVFLIHGGPQGAWEDSWSYRWNPSLWAAQGWVVVCPNPRGSTGFGQKFVDEISLDWGGKVMDDLTAVFDATVSLPFVDPKRTAVAGASYGGYAVNWLISQTNRFRAAVTHAGVFNLESMALVTEELWFPDWEFGGEPWGPKAQEQFAKWSPHRHAHKIQTPTLVITNELDFRVPVDQGLQLFTVLRRRGVPSEALVFPDEGHWVLKPKNSRRWHETVFAWLGKYLG